MGQNAVCHSWRQKSVKVMIRCVSLLLRAEGINNFAFLNIQIIKVYVNSCWIDKNYRIIDIRFVKVYDNILTEQMNGQINASCCRSNWTGSRR